ncbi:aminotransferase class V-fold PLP-dependent enzyme [Longispora albida]|uniref:aminotransferase class V-fold PLP-dependent enzyme n=1 Tax=Longispora albida TaxID=203523 RepID=UPI0003686031|nr:aminotransferase class V-fold PLP-dependent enzyme [Longispora albida]
MRSYLNYASMGRLRPRARNVMRAALEDVLPFGAAYSAPLMAAMSRSRAAGAKLLGCGPDELALIQNTSTGVHLVADGLSWSPGDEIVLFDRDFPANVLPWLRVRDRHGAVVRWVPMREDGGYDLADLEKALSPRTRVVAVSLVNFATGYTVDLGTVCDLAAGHGALVFCDAIQGLGALPLDVRETPVDFLTSGGHKWLCGPPGTGLFYARQEALAMLGDGPAGWFGYTGATDMLAKGPGHFTYDLEPRPQARRFEGGMPNLLGLLGFAESLEELLETGLPRVHARVLALAAQVREGVREAGYTLRGPEGSGIVAFAHPVTPAADLCARLADQGCHLSYPDGILRASPHYWTDDDEMHIMLAALQQHARN